MMMPIYTMRQPIHIQEVTRIRHFKHCYGGVKVKVYNLYCCSILSCALISAYHKSVLDNLSLHATKTFLKFDGEFPEILVLLPCLA